MGENIEGRKGEIKCIVCGYKVLKKSKPPVVKRVPAR
jgi:DNA-directed RNA polymerase subunit RPC12/RpoP